MNQKLLILQNKTFYKKLVKTAYFRIGVQEDAEDLVQDTILLYLTYVDTLNSPNQEATLYHILNQRLARAYQKKAKNAVFSYDNIVLESDKIHIEEYIAQKGLYFDFNEGSLGQEYKDILKNGEVPEGLKNTKKQSTQVLEMLEDKPIKKTAILVVSTYTDKRYESTKGKYSSFKKGQSKGLSEFPKKSG